MKEKGLFEEEEEEEGKSEQGASSEEEGLEGFLGEETEKPKKSRLTIFLVIGLVLVAGVYVASLFLSKGEKPVVPVPVKIPITEAPMANITGAKAVMAKQGVKEKAATKEKPKAEAKEAKKPEEAKKKAVAKAEVKKIEPKPEVKKPAEVKVAKKEEAAARVEKPAEEKAKTKGLTVVVGTYVTEYELQAAEEKLKGAGIRYSSKKTKKKLLMNRVLVKKVEDKGEANRLLSELKGKGYDPFLMHVDGVYKVYAVSNLNEDISNSNKADMEKLGYTPVIEKTAVLAGVYELSAIAKNKNEIGELSVKLKKIGFKLEF